MFIHFCQIMKQCFCIIVLAFLAVSCQESLEQRVEREAREHTVRNCPMEISPGFVNDSLTFDRQTHTVQYHFSLHGKADSLRIDSTLARQSLQTALLNATNLRIYKNAGFTFRYTYRSERRGNKVVFDFVFTPEDYR